MWGQIGPVVYLSVTVSLQKRINVEAVVGRTSTARSKLELTVARGVQFDDNSREIFTLDNKSRVKSELSIVSDDKIMSFRATSSCSKGSMTKQKDNEG